jgi:hypothetical protein
MVDLTTNDCTYAPNEWHDGIGPWLMFWLPYQLTDHGLYDSCRRSARGLQTFSIDKIPMLPLRAPPTTLPTRATQKLDANPTSSKEMIVPVHPINTTGLRPILSDKAPHAIPLHASAWIESQKRSVLMRDSTIPARRQISVDLQRTARWTPTRLRNLEQASTHTVECSSRQLALPLARGLQSQCLRLRLSDVGRDLPSRKS